MPLLLGALTVVFLVVILVQSLRDSDTPADELAMQPPTPIASAGDGERASGTGELQPTHPDPEPGAHTRSRSPEGSLDLGEVRATIQDYFARIPDRATPGMSGLAVRQALDGLRDYLATLPPDAVPLLLELIDPEVTADFVHRRYLLYALGDIGTDEAVDGLIQHYHRMSQIDLEHEIGHTVKALGRVDSPHSFQLLTTMIEREGRVEDRHRFLRVLGAHSMRQQALPLFTRMLGDDDSLCRINASQGIKHSGDRSVAPTVERAIREEQCEYTKQAMIGALGGLQDVNSVSLLDEVLQTDSNLTNRLSCVDSLYRIGGPDAMSVLQRVAEQDGEERVRFDAQRKLRKLQEGG